MPARKTVTTFYNGEEICAAFRAEFDFEPGFRDGSPGGWYMNEASLECTSVEIVGKEFPFDELPGTVQELILSLADECDWSDY